MNAAVAADPDTAFTVHQVRAPAEIDRECVRVAWRSVRDKIGKRRVALPAQQRQPLRKNPDRIRAVDDLVGSGAQDRVRRKCGLYAGAGVACTRLG